MFLLNDNEINELISESKKLVDNWKELLRLKPKIGHKEGDLDVTGQNGNEFKIIVRHSLFNPLDFSVILAYKDKKSSQLFRLRRYNGKSHEHSNLLEQMTFYDFHVHTATERYQKLGVNADSHAEPTDRYSDLFGAMDCMIHDCGFIIEAGPQMKLL